MKCRTRHAAPASTTVTHPTRAETAPWWQAWGWQKSIGSHARPWGQWGCPYGAFRVFPRFIPIAFLRVPAGTRSPTDGVLTRVLYRVTVLTARHCSDALFRYFSKNVYWLWLDVREPRKVPRTVPGGCPGGAVGGTVSMVCRCARSPVPHAIVTLKMTVADFLKTVRLRTPPHRDGPQRRR